MNVVTCTKNCDILREKESFCVCTTTLTHNTGHTLTQLSFPLSLSPTWAQNRIGRDADSNEPTDTLPHIRVQIWQFSVDSAEQLSN